MALIKCPECGKKFFEQDGSCPSCGVDRETARGLRAKSKKEKAAKDKEAQKGWLFGCLALFILTPIIGYCSTPPPPPDGPFVSYWEDISDTLEGKRHEGKYLNGLREGLWTTWNPKGLGGKKEEEGEYLQGEKEGLWTEWNYEGEKIAELVFKNDELQGLREEGHTYLVKVIGRPIDDFSGEYLEIGPVIESEKKRLQLAGKCEHENNMLQGGFWLCGAEAAWMYMGRRNGKPADDYLICEAHRESIETALDRIKVLTREAGLSFGLSFEWSKKPYRHR